MSNLYKYSANRTMKLPKRRRKWLGDNIDAIMNSSYSSVMEASTNYSRDENIAYETLCLHTKDALQMLQKLQSPLLVLWNVQKYEQKDMVEWAKFVNAELNLLNDISGGDGAINQIFILDWRRINSVEFLRNMSELHRYTHGKVANAKMCYDSTQGKLLIDDVNDAFYHLMLANVKIPETHDEYVTRQKHLKQSLSSLNKMNRSLLLYFNVMQYSENVMNEWSDLLVNEMKLISGLMKSDKERFWKL